jgi:predicted DCC family thiol-disulfide oxidoreductase YuxK
MMANRGEMVEIATPQLVDPDERPGAEVVIYDGQCRFCRAQVERLARWDRSGRLAFISLHDRRVSQRYPDLAPEQLMQDMYLIDRQQRRHRGAAALRYLSRRLPRLWPLVPLLHLPGTLALWQAIYRQVAKRRYWGGKLDECETGSCRVHGR